MICYSAVIPLFDKERHIERAIRSVAAQTVPPSEILVVDDGSTDGGAAIVKRLAAEITSIRLIQQENGGVSRARNVGIRSAGSEYIAFLDADDEWLSDFLEEIGHLMKEFPGAGLYATAYTAVGSDEDHIAPRLKSRPGRSTHLSIHNYFKTGFGGSPVWTSAAVVPKSTFEDVGLFVDGAGRGEDLEMWGRISLRHDIAFSSKACAVYHLDADNRSHTEGIRARHPKTSRWWVLDLFEEWLGLPDISADKKRWIREWIRRSELLSAVQVARSARSLRPLLRLPLTTLFSYSAFHHSSRFLLNRFVRFFRIAQRWRRQSRTRIG